MRTRRVLTLGLACLLMAAPTVRADAGDSFELFADIDTAPYLGYTTVVPNEPQAFEAYPITFRNDFSTPQLLVMTGSEDDGAFVELFQPVGGSAGAVGEFYVPPLLAGDIDTSMALGPVHLGGVSAQVDQGVSFVVADFDASFLSVPAQVIIGDSQTDFHLRGSLVSPGPTLPAMRIWGAQDGSVGRVQLAFELTEAGRMPDSDPSAHPDGVALPVGTLLYLDGTINLGTLYDSQGDPQETFTFTTALFDSGFGATGAGQIQVVSVPVPEPGTIALLAIGSIPAVGALRGRRRRR